MDHYRRGIMDDTGIGQILAPFGLTAHSSARRLPGGEDNDNVRVMTEVGPVVVRTYLLSGIDKVRAELALVAFLARSGFPTPAPLVADDGDLLVEADHPVALFPLVAGEVPAELTEHLAGRCGELLARLHHLTTGWVDPRIPIIDRVGVLWRAIDAPVAVTGVADWHEDMRAFLDSRRQELAGLASLPAGPLHHDLHRQNILVVGDDVVAVLDFDELNHGPLIIDLARVFHYLSVDGPDRRLPPGLATAVLAGYQRIRRLTTAERALLPMAFELVGLVDTADFMAGPAAELGLRHIDECHSWLAYRRNLGAVTDSERKA